MNQLYSSELVDQQISIAKNNDGKVQFDSIIFGNGDYVQVLQCNVNFKDTGSTPDPDPDPGTDYSKEIQYLQSEIDQLTELIKEIKNSDIGQDVDIQELQKQIAEITSQIQDLKKQIQEMKTFNEQMFQVIKETIKKINEKLKDLQSQIDELKEDDPQPEPEPEPQTGSSLKSGQFSVQTTIPNKDQALTAEQQIGETKQYVFKFDSECTPQNIVDSLEKDSEFMKLFFPVWDSQTNQFTIFAKKAVPDQTVVVFDASGSVSTMLGLSQTKYLIVYNTDSGYIYNKFTNFPKLKEQIDITLFNEVTRYQIHVRFDGFYSHNDLRYILENEYHHIQSDGTNDQYDVCFDIIPSNGSTKFVIVLLCQQVVKDQNSYIKIAVNHTGKQNLLKIKQFEIIKYQDKFAITISEVFDLEDETTPFKPESNNLYIRPQTQNMLRNIFPTQPNTTSYNYNRETQIIIADKTNLSITEFNYQPGDYQYITEFQNQWIQHQINQYLEFVEMNQEGQYLKCKFKKTDKFNGDLIYQNGKDYVFWFDQFNVVKNNNLIIRGQYTSAQLQKSNYPLFNKTINFKLTLESLTAYEKYGRQISYTFDMSQQIQKFIEKRQQINQYQHDQFYLNHNDFRNIWCQYTGHNEIIEGTKIFCSIITLYDYKNNQWTLSIQTGNELTQNNDWVLYFKGEKDSNYIGGVMKLQSDDIYLNDSNLWSSTGYTLTPGIYNFSTTDTVYKQDTNNLDTDQNTVITQDQWDEWNKSDQDCSVKFTDVILNKQLDFNMSKSCSFYDFIDEWNTNIVGKYFQAVVYQEDIVFIPNIQQFEDFQTDNFNSMILLVKWNNTEFTKFWFNDFDNTYVTDGIYLMPQVDKNQLFYQNYITFDQTLYWDKNLIKAQNLLTSSKKQIKRIQTTSTTNGVSHDIKYLKLYSDDVKATYKDLNNSFNKNGLVAVITENNYQPNVTNIFKIQGTAQPITFYLRDQDDKPYTNEIVLQVQFYKKEIVQ